MEKGFVDELVLCLKAGYPLIFVLTQEENRASLFIEEAAQQVGKTVTRPRGRGVSRVTEKIVINAAPGQILLLDAVHRSLDDAGMVRQLADFALGDAQGAGQAVIVAPWIDLPEELERQCAIIELPLPSVAELQLGLEQVCGEQGVLLTEEVQGEMVRVAQGLTGEEAERSFRKALIAHPEDAGAARHSVTNDKRIALRRSRVLEHVDTPGSMDEVGGLDQLKAWLYSRREAFTSRARDFGLPAPRGLLLMGIQGCGKSLTSKAVASFWKLPLLRLDLSAVFGMERPEQALRDALKVAEAMSPCVLWIDEIEKGFDKSGEGPAARLLGGMVIWLQEKDKEVFVVATANRVQSLPPELPRKGRFDEIFFVDLPNLHERREILELHLVKRGRDPKDFPVEVLAQKTDRFTGSELEQVIVAAMYLAFSRDDELHERDLLQTIKETVTLYDTFEDEIKKLRDWARRRARLASTDRRKADLFTP